ncbi:MAG: hypothetical protein K1X35_07790 [Caulobacteraceae bacterium]|nr:hypothetical protein [Caulobacteraceae bacterium]
MASRAKKPRKTAARTVQIQRSVEPLAFVAEQPRSFAYVEDDDEFEIPQIPSEFARRGREVRISLSLKPASSFDLVEA